MLLNKIKLSENWSETKAQLNIDAINYDETFGVFLIRESTNESSYIAYFQSDPRMCGAACTMPERQPLESHLKSHYGIYDRDCWAKVWVNIRVLHDDILVKQVLTALEIFEQDRKKIQLGVELELERSWPIHLPHLTKMLKKRLESLIDAVVNDSSVRGGTEIRFSHPPLERWDKEKITAALRYLKNLHYNHKDGTAGMHIHMSSGVRGDTVKAARRCEGNKEAMLDILYPICARPKKLRGVPRVSGYGLESNFTRGYTVHGTLEIRVWEATTNPDVFMARLKFADYLFRFLSGDSPLSMFFDLMSQEDKLNYKFLVETENPHAFGCGKDAAIARLKLGE